MKILVCSSTSIYTLLQTYFAFDSRAETEVYLRYGQHPELYPNRRGEIVQGFVSIFHRQLLFSALNPRKNVEKRGNSSSHGTCREWLILSFQPCAYLFYLQLILRTWVPWLSASDVLCAVARLSRALSASIEMPVSLAYAAAIYQAILTKRTVLCRWTKVCLCVFVQRPGKIYLFVH